MSRFLLALVAAAFTSTTSVAADRPNIIFIMSDDHAAHAIGAYGSRVNETPNLDRLAREGALLETSSPPTRSARRAAPRFSPASTRT